MGIAAVRTELNKRLKALKDIIEYLRAEKAKIKKIKPKKWKIEVEAPAVVEVKGRS